MPNIEHQKSVEIIGGGVAGLSLGIALRHRDVPVVIREAATYPRHRLCGEFINGVSDDTLRELGIIDVFNHAQSHHTMKWWLHNDEIAEVELPHPVRALSRWQMDERMRLLFESLGGDLRCRERVTPDPKEGRVWAAGRRLDKGSSWLGLKAHFINVPMGSGLEMHLGEGGYVGLTAVGEGRVNVCGLFKKREKLTGKGSAILLNYLMASGLDKLSSRLQDCLADESSMSGVSGISFGMQGHDPTMMTLGDAERMIPPFTGNGMSMALEAAESAVAPLLSYSLGKGDWSATCEELTQSLQRRFRQRSTLAKGIHSLILNQQTRGLLATAARTKILPMNLLNQLLT